MAGGNGCVKFGDAFYNAAVKLAYGPKKEGVTAVHTQSGLVDDTFTLVFSFDGKANGFTTSCKNRSCTTALVCFDYRNSGECSYIDKKRILHLQSDINEGIAQKALSHAFYNILGMDPKQEYCDGAPEIDSGWFFIPNTPITPETEETSSAIGNALRGMAEAEANSLID